MSAQLNKYNPIDYEGWDDLLKSNPAASCFHTSGWAKVLVDTYKYKPLYFASIADGKLLDLIPVMEINSFLTGRRGVSLPFSDYCEPIISSPQHLNDAIEAIVEHGQKAGWKHLELRSEGSFPHDWPASSLFYGHVLPLSDNPEAVFARFRSSIKRNIRKAQRENVQIEMCNSPKSVKEFYRLHCLTRKRHGLPPQPYRFFENILHHIISNKSGYVVLASYNGKTVSAAVYFHFAKKVLFKYGASDISCQHLRPNNLLMWKAIEWYCKNGFEKLSLGRTEIENEGLRRFKTGWGAQETHIKYYNFDFAKNTFTKDSKTYNSHAALFRRMPISLLRLIGAASYKHVG